MIPNFDQAIKFMSDQDEDWFNSSVVVDREVELDRFNASDVPKVRVVSYKPGNLELVVESARDRLMVVSNSFDKGWRLNFNDVRQPIYRVNSYFQGIRVAKGNNHYSLYYLPPRISWYVGLSVITLIAFILFLFSFSVKRHKTN